MKPRTRRSAKIKLIELLRPDPGWPSPYSLEMAFQALRCLIASATGQEFIEQHEWHTSCAVGLMGGAGARNGACRAVTSWADLKDRFVQALLARTDFRPEVARWREAKGIHVGAVLDMKFRHYKPFYPPAHLPWVSEAQIRTALDTLLQESTGKTLAVQLNQVHAEARIVHSVGIVVGVQSFRFVLKYGFHDPRVEPMDSSWCVTLAETVRDEPFLDTLAYAVGKYAQLTGADNAGMRDSPTPQSYTRSVASQPSASTTCSAEQYP